MPCGHLAHAMDGDDVRVRETGRHAGFPHEPVARLGITGEVSGQDLDGDVAIELHVARKVHHSHASAAELALERILAGQGGLQVEELGGRMRHDVAGKRFWTTSDDTSKLRSRSRERRSRVTTKRFESTVVRVGTKSYIPVPFDPNEIWGGKHRHYVKGTVGGHGIRGFLRLEGGGYALPLGPAWLRDNPIPTSATIDVVLQPDGPQSKALAADITMALNASPEAETFFQSVAPFYRKNFLRWIDQARRPETRAARIAEMVTMLEAGKVKG